MKKRRFQGLLSLYYKRGWNSHQYKSDYIEPSSRGSHFPFPPPPPPCFFSFRCGSWSCFRTMLRFALPSPSTFDSGTGFFASFLWKWIGGKDVLVIFILKEGIIAISCTSEQGKVEYLEGKGRPKKSNLWEDSYTWANATLHLFHAAADPSANN